MGGAPCLIIINEGGRAYGAIESFKHNGGTEDTSFLEAAVLTSCSLTSYGSLYVQHEGEELEGPVLERIGKFHKKLIEHIGDPGYDIAEEAEKLEKLNKELANLIEAGTYY